MKCLEISEIEDLIYDVDENSPQNLHIKTCLHCKQIYERVLNEHQDLRNLFSVESPKEINKNVMHYIYNHVRKKEPVSFVRQKKGWKKQRLLISLSVMLITGSFLYISGPTIAETFKSLLSVDSTDTGLLNAKKYGTILDPGVLVTDQDYTLKINEVSADGGRIVMALQLFNSDESSSEGMLNLGKQNHIYVQDENGKILGEFSHVGKTNNYYQLSVIFPNFIESESIKVVGEINQLGGTVDNPRTIQGDWNFNFALDLNEANQISTVKEINQSYAVPNTNIIVQVNRLIQTPSSTRLEMKTNSTSNELKVGSLMFHFEDDTGNEIHSIGSTKSGHKQGLLDKHQYTDIEDEKITHWSYSFINIPDEAIFVFDGLSLLEEDGSSVDFDFNELGQNMITFEGKNNEDQIHLNKVVLSAEGEDKTNQTIIKINGFSNSIFINDQWIIQRIGDTKIYPVQFRGGLSPSGSGTEISNNSEFVIEGLPNIEGEFKLVRTFVERLYTSVDWSIALNEK
ncbi:DUF4179 domain-containing protein [Paenibacillus sp. CN-4]|uniref:DUF4179 domain-containing protein n=1 Tax=Paenibacillus nanchangensis TaxID=3348343 RepID=UPI00397B54BB